MNIFFIVVIMLFTPQDAFAYFDPGTGSLIIQTIIGILAFAAVYWRRIIESIRSFFSRNNDIAPSVDTEKNITNETDKVAENKDESI